MVVIQCTGSVTGSLSFCFFPLKGEIGMCPQIRFGDSFRVGKGEDSRVLLVRHDNHLNFIQVCSRGILACDVGMLAFVADISANFNCFLC